MTTPNTGDIAGWGTITPPSNWLLCDGSAVSRTTFAALFAEIGTTWGAGDGSTTFNLPSGTFRFPRGATSPGGTGGTLNHDHTGAPHTHPFTPPSTHSDHATDAAHQHSSHSTANRGTTLATTQALSGPVTHNEQMAHSHSGTAHDHASPTVTGETTPAATGTNNPPFLTGFFIIRT